LAWLLWWAALAALLIRLDTRVSLWECMANTQTLIMGMDTVITRMTTDMDTAVITIRDITRGTGPMTEIITSTGITGIRTIIGS
jgi:hypothetical protein